MNDNSTKMKAKRRDDLHQAVYEQLCAMPTVDAHEHLHPENMRINLQVDIFLLFHQYLRVDFIGAGMDETAADALSKPEVPLDQKWDAVRPYLDRVRSSSIAAPPYAALRHFFNTDDLTKDNYIELTEKMRRHNTPGLYKKCLKESCNIVLVLNQNGTMWQTDLFKPILFEDKFIGNGSGDSLRSAVAAEGWEASVDLNGYVEQMEGLLRKRKEEGMIGVKSYCWAYEAGDRAEAASAYGRLFAGKASHSDSNAVIRHLRDRLFDICGRLNLVVVLHSGIWAGNWADIRSISPTHVYDIACAHKKTRFDLFHAATTQPADAGFLSRSLPNVYLNSCWSHLLSPSITKQAWDMWLDMLPINRVIAWGGDYWWAVENVYGVVDKVRDMLAEVLSKRIAAGDFTESQALEIARRWMHDNARSVYFLDEP